MMRNKESRLHIILEHKSKKGVYRYYTSKNRNNTNERLTLKKYSPLTKKHELFREIK